MTVRKLKIQVKIWIEIFVRLKLSKGTIKKIRVNRSIW